MSRASRSKRTGFAVLLYLILATAGHIAWEAAQLPLYTIWWTGTRREILFAVAHCTGGDLLITASALALAALVARIGHWPLFGSRMVLTAILFGLGYSVFCCDCLGYTSAAFLPPQLAIAPAELGAQIHYEALTTSLSGRAVLPEPGPPRPVSLS